MRRICISLLLVITVGACCFAQSPQSDSLYAKGVEMYEREQYAEALKYFEKSKVLDEAELDSLSSRRGYSADWMASCYYRLGDEANAIKYGQYHYKFKPIDRRKTCAMDSLADAMLPDLMNNRPREALEKLKRLSELEHAAFDENHYIHIMTNRYRAMCHMNLRQADKALPYVQEARRLIRHNYGELDTLQMPELNNQLNIYVAGMQYDRAEDVLKDLDAVVKANYDERHAQNANVKYLEIALQLSQRKWENAKMLLPEYMAVLERCFADNIEMLQRTVGAVRTLFTQCGRNAECAYIDELSEPLLLQSSKVDSFNRAVLALTNDIQLKRDERINERLTKLEDGLNDIPADKEPQCRAVLECVRCFYAMSRNKIDEAKDLYLRMERNDYENMFKDKELVPVYLSVKSTMSVLLSDFEGAAEAVDKTVEMSESMKWENLDLKGYQASLNAMAGKYDKAKEITRNTVRQWQENVIDTKALYRLDKDTAVINKVLTMFDTYIQAAGNMTDSVRYTLREIKSDYLLLKARMLENLEQYQISPAYYDCISDYAFELVRMRKYPEAQKAMDDWIADWKKTFDSCYPETLDPATLDEDEKWKLYDAIVTMEDALEFRCHHCYEPKDPAGIKAFEDLLEYDKREYSDGENSGAYITDKIKYYKFIRDNRGLIDYLAPILDSESDENEDAWYRTISDAYEADGDHKNSILYLEKFIHRVMGNSVQSIRNEENVFNSIDRIIKYYTKEEKDTARILEFYSGELWPAMDTDAGLRYRFFIKSINSLATHIDDDTFIPYVEREMDRTAGFIRTPCQKACLYGTIAGVLAYGSDKRTMAVEYIDKARELVGGNEALSLMFGCNKHRILYNGPYDSNDKAIELGYELISAFDRLDSVRNTHEYICLVERQIEMLQDRGRSDEVIELGKSYIGYREKHENEPIAYLLNGEHPEHEEIDLLKSNVLQDYTWLPDEYVREGLYRAYSVKDPKTASKYALNVVNTGFEHLRTSMDVNSVSTWQCDNLISKTSKMAYLYKTEPLRNYAYDAALACKGLQMQSNKAVRALIKKSGHKGALRKFDDLEAVMSKISVSTGDALDSLLTRRDELEKDLHRLSRYFGDYKNAIFTSWTKVQSSLGEHDLAIEMTYVQPDYRDETAEFDKGYFACVLGKHMAGPDIVFIANGDSIATGSDAYRSTKLSKKILAALKPYLKGVENIYYSPIGAFSQIAVESLPMTDDLRMTLASRYNIYRVSSTRQILNGPMYVDGENAVVYGGLKYNATVDELKEDAKKYTRSVRSETTNDAEVDLRSLRGLVRKLPYLQGTAAEAASVVERINAASDSRLQAVPMIGTEGTEASFKSLGGKQTRIIHLATHGFYFDEREFKAMKDSPERQSGKLKQEDRSLMRSGLFMAGSDNAYRGLELPAGLDDGILTSHEIANIDLTGLDLCVLSACQTAQGDISSEGVYGLQRGFKKAGARSILMSLWEVDDEATSFMMTEFYRQWITNGKSKYQALELAKQAVKSHAEKGWDDPDYWASFVLLDAVDN